MVTTADFSIREVRREDGGFLSEMLYEAATWRRGPDHPLPEAVLSRPDIAVYLDGWGRPGDEGLVAENGTGERVGAAWYRLFSQAMHGFGFVNAETPELTLAVREDVRGRGIGSALLDSLIARARERGLPALSLSVEPDNPAFRLYERAAFYVVHRGGSLTMVRDLAS